MSALMYHILSSSSQLSLGLYHLINTTRNYLKSPRNNITTTTSNNDYFARPYHPLNTTAFGVGGAGVSRLKYIQLYLLILCLLVATVHQTLLSYDADPLLKGRTSVHRFTSLQSASLLFCFLLLSLSLLLSESTSLLPNLLPPDLFFAIASALFFLQYSVSSSAASVQTSDLQAKCDSVSATISLLSSVLCLVLASHPRLFVADVGLGASICLQGLWVLQTGLSLYVDAFIPEGCHKLLDVVSGIEGSTKCDLEDSKLRAVAILDLVFVVHVLFVLLIVLFTYALVSKTTTTTTTTIGINRRLGSYEALPNAAHDTNHVQMKAITGTQA